MIIALALLTACQNATTKATGTDPSGLPIGRPVTRQDLLRFPESDLRYPGSHLVRLTGADQTPTGHGDEPNPAYVGAILSVAAAPSQLFAWYAEQLQPRGFGPTLYFRPSTQSSGQAWERHKRLQVQVGVFDQPEVPAGTTVYEELLVGYAPGLPKY